MEENINRLRELLRDSDSDVRGMTAVALARVGDPQATDLLLELLKDSDRRVAIAAIQSLGEREDKKATPCLLELVHSDDPDIVCSVIAALALLRDERAFNAVVTALFDVNDEVRRNAAAAIGRLGDLRALVPLYEALKDPYKWVRGNAALSIGMFAQTSSTSCLLDAFATEADEDVRGNIIIALGACDTTKTSMICDLLQDHAESERLRVSAAITLANLVGSDKIADEEQVRLALIAAMEDKDANDEVRAACAWALGRTTQHGSTTDALLAVLDDEYRWVVLYAVESLALLKDPRSVAPLQEFKEAHADDDELVEHIDAAILELEGRQ